MEQENEIEDIDHEVKIMELKVREKEQESRLADLKLKELRRSLKHRSLKPLASNNTPKIVVKGKEGRLIY